MVSFASLVPTLPAELQVLVIKQLDMASLYHVATISAATLLIAKATLAERARLWKATVPTL